MIDKGLYDKRFIWNSSNCDCECDKLCSIGDNDYIGYIVIEKIDEYENIHSVNRLYLIIHSATGYFKEKNGEKYLIIDSTEKYEEIFPEIRSEIETLNNGKEWKMELILTMIYL